jgi:hypothetical protein
MTDYQPLQVNTPWKRAVFMIGCAAVLLLGALGAAVIYAVKHLQTVEKPTAPPTHAGEADGSAAPSAQ